MANVYPFRALRFSSEKVQLDRVFTQPYDKISPDMQERYYALHPNNLIRIVKGKPEAGDGSSNSVYTRAAACLRDWRESGVLEEFERPGFFAYFQEFPLAGSPEVRVRKGFTGLGQLEEYSKRIVFPHEKTLTGPKADRLELLRQTRTHLEQIFMLYSDPAQGIDALLDRAASCEPDIQVEDEYGVTHKLWLISEEGPIASIQDAMAGKPLIIADGHHRYETSLAFRDEMRSREGKARPDAPYERMMMTFFNMDSPGLTVLPTHRLVSNLPSFDPDSFLVRAAEYFEIEEWPYQNFAERSLRIENMRSAMRRRGERSVSIGVVLGGRQGFFTFTLRSDLDLARSLPEVSERQRGLDVVILHRLLLEKCLGITEEGVRRESHLTYLRDAEAGIEAVERGQAKICFFLNPTRLEQVRDIAFGGEVLPQKSTDFYPKLLSGLTIYPL